MRKLTANEKRLSILFGAMVLVVANLFVLRWAFDAIGANRARIAELSASIEASRQFLADAPYWEARSQWVEAHPPPTYAGRSSDSALVESIQATVSAKGLTTEAQQLLDTEEKDGHAVPLVEFTLRGGLRPIVEWLHETQQPGNYVVVESFTLRQTQDGEQMELRVRLGKIFRLAAASP